MYRKCTDRRIKRNHAKLPPAVFFGELNKSCNYGVYEGESGGAVLHLIDKEVVEVRNSKKYVAHFWCWFSNSLLAWRITYESILDCFALEKVDHSEKSHTLKNY